MPDISSIPLADFLAGAGGRLSLDERAQIVDRAITCLTGLYAHLPLKRAMFAIDPVGRLSLLKRRLKLVSELAFHREMLSIFAELRDLHTLYLLPEPFRSRVAFLPFLVEEYFEGEAPRYMVSKAGQGIGDPRFAPGATLVSWSGVPIARAVEISAERHPGSNDAARRARGVHGLTIRPLDCTPWPDEEWVDVGYRGPDEALREIRLMWRVSAGNRAFLDDAGGAMEVLLKNPEALSGGIDRAAEAMRRTRKALYAPRAVHVHRRMSALWDGSGGAAPENLAGESRLPDNFSYRTVRAPHGELGYVRIWSFENTTAGRARMPIEGFVDAFVQEFLRILASVPPNGLILDIRGNPGGRIPAGERILELLTPAPITPAPLCFRSTPLSLALCRRAPRVVELGDWASSIAEDLDTGTTYSRGLPFVPFSRSYNGLGQRYHGPVVLIVDALSYSTSDVFAASFQDHGIGPVLGTDASTGAGGANVWPYEVIAKILEGVPGVDLAPLPGGASFTLALRRVTRLGPRAGAMLENLGVTPDVVHRLTRDDLFNANESLIARAGELLAGLPARTLDLAIEPAPGALRLGLTTRGLTRVDIHADGRPRLSVDVADGTTPVDLPCPAAPPRRLELLGFDGATLAARRLADGITG